MVSREYVEHIYVDTVSWVSVGYQVWLSGGGGSKTRSDQVRSGQNRTG